MVVSSFSQALHFKLRFFLLAVILLKVTLYAQAFEPPWQGIKAGPEVEIYVYENFPDKQVWLGKTNNTMEIQLYFHKKLPTFDLPKSPYEEILKLVWSIDSQQATESQKYFSHSLFAADQFSLEARMYMNRPGTDYFTLEKFNPRGPEKILGRPLAIAIWVFGYEQKHHLYARFSNARKKIHDVSLGLLDFKGWDRLEAKIPQHIQVKNPKNQNQFDFYFHGFKIISSPKQEAGLAQLHFARVLLLIDHQQKNYPGAQQQDLWR